MHEREDCMKNTGIISEIKNGLEFLGIKIKYSKNELSLEIPGLENDLKVIIGKLKFNNALSHANALGPDVIPDYELEFVSSESQLRYNPRYREIAVILHDSKKIRSIKPQFVAHYTAKNGWTLYLYENNYVLLKFLRWFTIIALIGIDTYMHLHGSLIEMQDSNLLLLGRKNAGKTTTTIGLIELGFDLLCDDAVFLDSRGRHAGIYPSGISVIRADMQSICQFKSFAQKVLKNYSDCIPITDESNSKLEIPDSIFQIEKLFRSKENSIKRIVLLHGELCSSIEDLINLYSSELWKNSLRFIEFVIKRPESFIDGEDPRLWIKKEWERRQSYWNQVLKNASIIYSSKEFTPSLRVLSLYKKLIRDRIVENNAYTEIAKRGFSPHLRSIKDISRNNNIDDIQIRKTIHDRIKEYIEAHPCFKSITINNMMHLYQLLGKESKEHHEFEKFIEYLTWKYWLDYIVAFDIEHAIRIIDKILPISKIQSFFDKNKNSEVILAIHNGAYLGLVVQLARLLPCTFLGSKTFRDPTNEKVINVLVNDLGLELVSSVSESIEVLNSGKHLIVFPDRTNFVRPKNNLKIRFFEESLAIQPGIFKICNSRKCNIAMLSCLFNFNENSNIEFFATLCKNADGDEVLKQYSNFLEKMISYRPTQWDRTKYFDEMLFKEEEHYEI